MASQRKRSYATAFKPEYSVEFPCIAKGKEASTALCKVCNITFSVAHGGRDDCKKHISTKKHASQVKVTRNVKPMSAFFGAKESTLDQAVTRAETYFTSFLVEHNIPLAASDHAARLFKSMFLDSAHSPKEIIDRYACGRTKTTAIANELAADARSNLIAACAKGPFNLATDGSNEKSEKLYPLVISYSNEHLEVKSELLSVLDIKGPSTGENIAKHVKDELKSLDIPLVNCVSLCTDNANTMIGQKKGLYGCLLLENGNIFATGCVCHRYHLAAEWAAKELPVDVDALFQDVYFYMEKSAGRLQTFENLQKEAGTAALKVPKHVATR